MFDKGEGGGGGKGLGLTQERTIDIEQNNPLADKLFQ